MSKQEDVNKSKEIEKLSYNDLLNEIIHKAENYDLSWFSNWLNSDENNNSIDSLRCIFKMMQLDDLAFADYFEIVKKKINSSEINDEGDFRFYLQILKRITVARYLLGDVLNYPIISQYLQALEEAYPDYDEKSPLIYN